MAQIVGDGARYIEKYYESGTLNPHRFVMAGTAETQFKPIVGATDVPIGVLGKFTTAKTTIKMPLQHAGECLVEVGTGGATAFEMGKLVDTNGCVTNATPTYGTEYIVCRFLESGVAGDIVRAELIFILP